MKKLLLILCLGCTVTLSNAQDQNNHSIRDSHHNLIGYISGGKIIDASNNVIASFKPDNGALTVTDKNHTVVGYVSQGKEIQDANHHTLGFINIAYGASMATIVNAQGQTLGYVNTENGAVQDNNHTIIGYEMNTELMWAVPYFFFFKF